MSRIVKAVSGPLRDAVGAPRRSGYKVGDIVFSASAMSQSWIASDGSDVETDLYPRLARRIGGEFNEFPTVPLAAITAAPDIGRMIRTTEDGVYVAMGCSTTSPFLAIYKRSGDTLTKLADPTGGFPTNSLNDVTWTPDGVYLITIQGSTAPIGTLYKRTGDTFAKIAWTSGIGVNGGDGAAWDPTGTYLGIGVTDSPFVKFYSRSGDVITAASNPATLPGASGYGTLTNDGVKWYVFGNGYISLYTRSGTTWTYDRDVFTLTGQFRNPVMSADGGYIAVTFSTAPWVLAFKVEANDDLTLLDNDSTPLTSGNDITIDADARYLAVGVNASPFIISYEIVDDVITDRAPLTAAVSIVRAVELTPDAEYFLYSSSTSPFIAQRKTAGQLVTLPDAGSFNPAGKPVEPAFIKAR